MTSRFLISGSKRKRESKLEIKREILFTLQVETLKGKINNDATKILIKRKQLFTRNAATVFMSQTLQIIFIKKIFITFCLLSLRETTTQISEMH